MLRDTWEWNGTTWTQRFPATTPTDDGFMAYDVLRGRVVMASDRTWEWNGTDWSDKGAVPAIPGAEKLALW